MKIAPQPAERPEPRESTQVHIEELVLHGFAFGDRHQIAKAVESELAKLISAGGVPEFLENPPALGRINGGAFQVKAGAKPQAAGTQIAQAVYRSLRGGTSALARSHRTRPGSRSRQP